MTVTAAIDPASPVAVPRLDQRRHQPAQHQLGIDQPVGALGQRQRADMFEEISRFLLAGAFRNIRAHPPFVINDDRLESLVGGGSARHGRDLVD